MSDLKNNTKIIKNASHGYGYKYSSLADLAEAGVEIPVMRVKPTEFGEFIEYLDRDGNWQIGAKIVEFEAKGMNRAQMYGSALTYARRYTVQMAQSVACDDDKGVESSKPVSGGYTSSQSPRQVSSCHVASEKQISYLRTLYKQGGVSEEDIEKYMVEAKSMTSQQISQMIERAKQRLDEKDSVDNLPTEDEV